MSKVAEMGGLLRRYCVVVASAWRSRHERERSPLLKDELAFLPAHLELAESPTHPAPRRAMYTIAGLAVAIILIACFGRLDIVVSAKGKLVPNARVKIVQPAVTGVVQRILVQDGERVHAGEVLLELDSTQAEADADKARAARVSAALATARARVLLSAQEGESLLLVPTLAGATVQELTDTQHLAEGLFREYSDKLAMAKAELARREADLQSTEHDIQRLKQTAPLAREEANDYKSLVAQKYVAKSDYLDKEQNAIQQEHDLDSKTSHAADLEASIVGQRANIASTSSQFRREQLDALDKANQELLQDRGDEAKAVIRQKLMTLSAPVSGTVQHLSVHTLRGVVTSAQTLMEIVPDDDLEVEANIESKDVGFVEIGQEAVVKIDSFPYTRYGYITGSVRAVSNNAIQDGKQNLSFVTHVHLPTDTMRIQGQSIKLTAGMAVSIEVKTGKRSVAGYFLDPLVQTSKESLRER